MVRCFILVGIKEPLLRAYAHFNKMYDHDQALKGTYRPEALTSKGALSKTEGKTEKSKDKIVLELDDQKNKKVILPDPDAKSN